VEGRQVRLELDARPHDPGREDEGQAGARRPLARGIEARDARALERLAQSDGL
jgi:hypothetical protein